MKFDQIDRNSEYFNIYRFLLQYFCSKSSLAEIRLRPEEALSLSGFLHWTLSSYHGTNIQVGSDQWGCVWNAHKLTLG